MKRWRQLQVEVYALYLAYRDPRVPWYARWVMLGVVGLAFSPIDLIPDFIPILGYLDDLILIPAGVALTLKLIPAEVLNEYRHIAAENPPTHKPKVRAAAGIILGLWVVLVGTGLALLFKR